MAMRMLRLVFTTALVFGVVHETRAATLEAQLDRTAIVEGETVRLRLRSPLSGAGSAPDLRALERDFDVLSTQRSQRISIVQGRQEASLDWIVTLLPRRVGTLEIPSLRSGGAMSRPLSIEVTGASTAAGSDRPDLFVEGAVDRMSPHVQSTFRYTVRVYDGVGLRSGSLGAPDVPDAHVRAVGEGREYDEVVEGRPYRVHERKYLVTPLKSGSLRIPPVVLEGRIDEPRGRRSSPFGDLLGGGDPFGSAFAGTGFGGSLFDRMMRPGRTIRVRSNEISLDVLPRPEGASEGWFLPAFDVELQDSFDVVVPTLRVGEAVERKVVLRARGSSAEQLPEIVVPAPEGARQYEEGVRDGDVAAPGDAVAVREQTVSIVPTREGKLTLPAVEVHWWDIEAGEGRIARIAERTIEVLPGVAGSRSAAGPPDGAVISTTRASGIDGAVTSPMRASGIDGAVTSTERASGVDGPVTSTVPASGVEGSVASAMSASWVEGSVARVSLSALAALVLLGFSLFIAARRWRTPRTIAATSRGESERVRLACRSGDASAVRDAVIAWSHARFGSGAPGNPRGVARRLGHEGLAREATLLDRVIYAPGRHSFDGESFWREFRSALRSAPGSSSPSMVVLPELYPGA